MYEPNWCCELLSKFVSLFFDINDTVDFYSAFPVVNCFQNLYLCSLI